MQFNEFTNFLDGFLFDKNRDLTVEETKVIKDKLNSCFVKVTPILPQTVGLMNAPQIIWSGNPPIGQIEFNNQPIFEPTDCYPENLRKHNLENPENPLYC